MMSLPRCKTRGSLPAVARAIAALFAFVAMPASAHPLAPALLELAEREDGRVEVTWKAPLLTQGGASRRPVLPPACRHVENRPGVTTAASATQRWIAECGAGGLVGQRVGVAGLDATGTDALLRVTLADGRVAQTVLRANAPELVIPARTTRTAIAFDYARLGFDHILGGADHLLFVFGLLLLVGGGWRLVQTVTAFTVGHSVTLSLAVLGYVRFPSGPIEVLIAASVLWLAVELASGEHRTSWMRRMPWAMAGSFGLLHGLGFAGALAEAGLPDGDIPLALATFNAGIEAGQLAFLLAILALRRLLGAPLAALPAWSLRVPVYAMGSLAAFWLLERATTAGF
jgi:hypothetical protein